MMVGKRSRTAWHRRTQCISDAYEFTTLACFGFGGEVLVIQWLIWNSGESARPRLGAQLKSDGVANVNGVSCTTARAVRYAGWYQVGLPVPCSESTSRFCFASIIRRSVGGRRP